MFNYRHSLQTINNTLKGYKVEFAYAQAGRDVYRLCEFDKDYNKFIECGLYYTKSDLVNDCNKLINKE